MKKRIELVSPLRSIGSRENLYARAATIGRFLQIDFTTLTTGESDVFAEEFSRDNEKFFAETIQLCENKLPEIASKWAALIADSQNAKWVSREYGNVISVIVSNFTTIALTSPISLLEIVLICTGSPTVVSTIPHIITWFIRRADETLITDPDTLSQLGHTYYREYVARLPMYDLNAYLCSPDNAERVIAKNKIRLEAESE